MNYLFYPLKIMGLTQTYLDTFSHKSYYQGKPQGFPIDEAEFDSGRGWFYCPCDEMIVKRIYGLGSTTKSNTIWLQSTTKVQTPTFNDYFTMLVCHPEDEDFIKLKIGQKFKRGEQMFREGKDGQATGNHFHIETAKGIFTNLKNNGWQLNSLGAWVIGVNAVKPEDCFFINPKSTTIKNARGLKFIKLYGTPVNKNIIFRQVEVKTDILRVRKSPNGEVLGYIKRGVYNILEEKEGWLKIEDGYIGIGEWLAIYEIPKPIEPIFVEPIIVEKPKLLDLLLEFLTLLIERMRGK